MASSVSLTYKLRKKAQHHWDRVRGKVENALFLASNREAVRKINAHLPYRKYVTRRTSLTAYKYQILEKLSGLQLEGKLRRNPGIFTRTKTFKSMNDKIERLTFKIDHPEFMTEDETQKIRNTVKHSQDIPTDLRPVILETVDRIDAELTKPRAERKKIAFPDPVVGTLKESITDRIVSEALGIRIIVDTPQECYAIKEILDGWAQKTGGKIRKASDFIKKPTAYGYQSIHTSYEFGDIPIEIQLRTWDMQKKIDEIDRQREAKAREGQPLLMRIAVPSGAKIRKDQGAPPKK
ncbi:MAG: hypothetical protein HY917_04300 [Candidatus Diapherotrites archaeon]|nr:hypothetical protein [Candidatus Diapherotrites archaeon]